MIWQRIIYLHLFCVLNTSSIMAVRKTGSLLLRLRDLMKLKYAGEPIQGYIVLSEDAHQVRGLDVTVYYCTVFYYY